MRINYFVRLVLHIGINLKMALSKIARTNRILWGKLRATRILRNFSSLRRNSTSSQEAATGPTQNADEFSKHVHNFYTKINFSIILLSRHESPKWSLPLSRFGEYFCLLLSPIFCRAHSFSYLLTLILNQNKQ